MLCYIFLAAAFASTLTIGGYGKVINSNVIPDEKWGYVKVRPSANMFWWLYGAQTLSPSDRAQKPLVMWLQGGPGASSTGFGNFVEIGPLDVQLKARNTTWNKEANLLFVDNPVGCGFSYVTDDRAYTKNVADISRDLLTFFKAFLKQIPVFQTMPFYMMGESYGGKMIAAFGQVLHNAIQSGEVACNFKGVALGDSAISVPDTVLKYGSYLYSLSLLDENEQKLVDHYGNLAKEEADQQNFKTSFDYCAMQNKAITNFTDNVDFYNILYHNAAEPGLQPKSPQDRAFEHYVQRFTSGSLSDLMNGPIRKKLGIIPSDVIWGAQGPDVMKYQYGDVVSPVLSQLSFLINAGYHVVVYEGQLDMICLTTGAELWMKKLTWPGLENWLQAPKQPIYPPSGLATKQTGAFLKQYQNLQFYYILKAGHMVPVDAPEMALDMMRRIISAGTIRA